MLFLVYLLMLVVQGMFFLIQTGKGDTRNNTAITTAFFTQSAKSDTAYPDIFFIMPDCYPSSAYQMEMLNYDNHYFDSVLLAKGFYVASASKSNYNRTQFSIPSTLDMEYLTAIDTSFSSKALEYFKALKKAENNSLIAFLKKIDYQFINLSIFDLNTIPAFTKEYFIRASENDIIFNNTFLGCYKRDISWKFFQTDANKDALFFSPEMIAEYKTYKEHNRKVIDSLRKITDSGENNGSPKMVYAHLYLPHYPYFYTADGKAYPDDELYRVSAYTDKSMFKAYIQYSNTKLLEVIERIERADKKKNTIIILQSDHGFDDIDTSRPGDAFRNYKAVYFPDRNYKALYDSMSNVNTFRVVLNKYFHQHLPMLKDSSFYMP
ncbi:MAG: sulfatase-like hydrolase/transferase [Agriterribacter sp.]